MPAASLRRVALGLLSVVVAVATLAALLPVLADLYWAFELPGHFRAQYAVCTLAATGGFMLLKSWRGAMLSAAAFVLIAAPVAALWLAPTDGRAAGATLDVLSLNVSFYGENQDTVRALIDRVDPDLVALIEVDGEWVSGLGSIERTHPYVALEPAGRRPGVALISRLPFVTAEIRPLVNRQVLVATVEFQAREIVVAVVHTASPLWGERAAQRDRQLRALVALADEGDEVVLVGDFNTSPWSLAFSRLVRGSGLRNAARGFGYQPTWPAGWSLLGIPIDHCLVSDGIAVAEFSTVGPTDSDHLAIHARLGLRGNSDPPPAAP